VIAVEIVVALLMLAGLVGAVVPFIPGTPLIFVGALVYAIATDFSPVGAGRLAVLAVLAVAGWTLEHVAGAVGARRAGASRAAVVGALGGTLVGLAFAPLGLLLGPIVGAILGEILAGRGPAAVRIGLATGLGVVAGVVAHAAVGITMVALFAWWIWRAPGLS
jgi:uncharacterized protein YqgC (DUF456 family)